MKKNLRLTVADTEKYYKGRVPEKEAYSLCKREKKEGGHHAGLGRFLSESEEEVLGGPRADFSDNGHHKVRMGGIEIVTREATIGCVEYGVG